jgi:predicted Na+-dependent transporter
MFNADLALSVTMTAISTMLSIIMLPINLMMYAKFSFEADVVAALNWRSLFIALAVVIGAIILGLFTSYMVHSHSFNKLANATGNISGLLLIAFSSVMSNSNDDAQLWERHWTFYVGVSAPCVFGLIIANIMTSYIGLKYPERMYVEFCSTFVC